VLDLEVTPNRPDLLSHRGFAREVGAFEQERLLELPSAILSSHAKHATQVDIKIENHQDCPRYTGVVMEVVVKESPWWIQSRLYRCGIRPINVVVDIANYVMLELGQPMHTFDADKLGTDLIPFT
jgi:phenylalanyl-tRNA synthetase beta chain